MIAIFITIFIAVIVGVSLVGPISDQVYGATTSTANLTITSSWGSTVLKLVPGFFALIILGVVVAGLYTVFRQAGIV